jgi:cell division septum initiation protein DivIVA
MMSPQLAHAIVNLNTENVALKEEVRELKQKLQHHRTTIFDLRLVQRDLTKALESHARFRRIGRALHSNLRSALARISPVHFRQLSAGNSQLGLE